MFPAYSSRWRGVNARRLRMFARPGAVVDVSPALVPLVGPAGELSRRLTATYHGGAFSMQLVGEGLLHPGLVER